jgi:ATPase
MNERYSLTSEYTVYIPDTSVIINGGLRKLLEESKIETNAKIIIHAALLSELEHLANIGKRSGIKGFEELTHIRNLCDKQDISINYEGRRPRLSEVKRAKSGEIDALIRDFAWKVNGILITSDTVQHLSAESIGIESQFIHIEKPMDNKTLRIEKYFTNETMSIHLKQGAPAYVKKGTPGNVSFEQFSDKVCTKEYLRSLTEEIIDKAQLFEDTFIEIERDGSTIIQYANMRIVICRPPFSDGWEITAVKPFPGAGKTTFTRALALFYENKSKIVKTIESPRDLDLTAEITQYSKNFGTHSEIHDILLLSRPDYTIFDEIRDTEDFRLYTDLRLAGIGLVGVIHSSTAIDAIQRFIGRLELGVIPSVLDTIIYIDSGQIGRILEVKMTVKVPAGLVESDLARPVVEVRDFMTGEVVYEMYTFGDQTVVIPLEDETENYIRADARTIHDISEAIDQFTSQPVVLIPKDRYGKRFEIQCAQSDIPSILGRGGETIRMLENTFHVKLDINKTRIDSLKGNYNVLTNSMLSIRKKTLTMNFPRRMKNKDIQFFTTDKTSNKLKPFFVGTISRSGKIKLSTYSDAGKVFKEGFENNHQRILWKEV